MPPALPLLLRRLSALALIWVTAQPALAQQDTSAPSEVLYQRAMAAMTDGLPEVAAESLAQFIKTLPADDPRLPTIELQLAEALTRSGQAAQAIPYLEKPTLQKLAEGPFWLAEAYALTGQFEKALEQFKVYLRPQGNRYRLEAAESSASLLLALGRPDEASSLLSSLKVANSAALELLLAEIALRQGKPEQALKALATETTDIDPELQDARNYVRARALLKLQRGTDALTATQKISKEPIPGAKSMLSALAQHQLKQEGAALDALLELIQTSPASPFVPNAFDLLRQLKSAGTQGDLDRLARWTSSDEKNIAAEALYTRALLLADTPTTKAEAIADLQKLSSTYPSHYLASPAQLRLALLLPAESSLPLLDQLIGNSLSPSVRNRARFIRANRLAKQEDFASALALMEQIETSPQGTSDTTSQAEAELAARAQFNRALIALISKGPAQVQLDQLPEDYQARLKFEFALSAASRGSENAEILLIKALADHPQHEMVTQARISLATTLLEQPAPPTKLIELILAKIVATKPAQAQADALDRLQIALAREKRDWPALIKLTKAYLARSPDSPLAPTVKLELGKAYFEAGEFNKAQVNFTSLADLDELPQDLKVNALYLSALAAARTGTAQALEQAVEIYDQVAKFEDQLSKRARLDAAKLLFKRLNSPTEALKRINGLDQDTDPMISRQALSLQADIYGSLVDSDPNAYATALAKLDRILAEDDLPIAWQQRTRLRRAEISELAKRPKEALADYFKILTPAGQAPVGSALFFEKAGFASMRILESQRRWQAAAKIADRIAAANGPRAQEAAARSTKLTQNHQLPN